jgi:hypothetical protein
MNRREVITVLTGAACGAGAGAGDASDRLLSTTTPGPFAHFIAGFRRDLQEVGYLDGRNVVIEYCWAEGRYDPVPARDEPKLLRA